MKKSIFIFSILPLLLSSLNARAEALATAQAEVLAAVLTSTMVENSFRTTESISSISMNHETGIITVYSHDNNNVEGGSPLDCVRNISFAVDSTDVWNPKYSVTNVDLKCK
jgi:hypothetical protein